MEFTRHLLREANEACRLVSKLEGPNVS